MSSRFRPTAKSLIFFVWLAAAFSNCSIGFAQSEKIFELRDGDRVVFVGNTFVERAIDYGHIEAALTLQWPDRKFSFRNLGWSGDDARGRARRFFGPVEDGFKHLQTHVEGLKPNVLFVSYGAMESYAGREGVSDFETNMNALLDMLDKTGTRIVLLSPVPQENLGPPLPNPTENNANLKLYTASVQSLAARRGCWFIDLFSFMSEAMDSSHTPLTDNGVHLNSDGYRAAARGILSGMGFPPTKKILQMDGQGNLINSLGVHTRQIQPLAAGLLVTLENEGIGDGSLLTVSIPRLFVGSYNLSVNGRNLGIYNSHQWAAGIQLPWTPEVDQTSLLTQTIVTKNEFYFHKWRPQNETYLRGFRKHEQGQNAAELEQFDTFIEKEELKIADLKRPRTYTLHLQRVMER